MSRLAALVRHALDVPSRAELMPRLREVRVVVTALANHRAACAEPDASVASMGEAMEHATRVCQRYMACQPLEDERPLVPMEPAPEPTPAPGWLPWVALVALALAALAAWAGCTIRGGACESDDACAPGEFCTQGRCRPPQPQEPPPLPPGAMCVPAPGGPL